MKFWGPKTAPPWVTTETPPCKRQCLGPASADLSTLSLSPIVPAPWRVPVPGGLGCSRVSAPLPSNMHLRPRTVSGPGLPCSVTMPWRVSAPGWTGLSSLRVSAPGVCVFSGPWHVSVARPSQYYSKPWCVSRPGLHRSTSTNQRLTDCEVSPFPAYSEQLNSRSVADMAEKCQATHRILSETMHLTNGPSTVHAQLKAAEIPIKNPRIRAPPPQQVVALLRNEVSAGSQIGHVLDLVSAARASNSVRKSSLETYLSHLRSVVAVCDLLKEPVVPASTRTIRRYTAICNNPVTLRGHLAAWKLVHTVLGVPWPGQNDPFVRAAQAGLLRLQPPPAPKMAIRRGLALRLAHHCFSLSARESKIFGIMVAMSYLYALRVPSELLRQWTPDLLCLAGSVWTYGPIRRKNLFSPVSLQRKCICNSKYALLCPHSWLHLNPTKVDIASWTLQRFNEYLRGTLRSLGVSPVESSQYCSHDFRRGCAKDLLEHAGPAAMMGHCGWSAQRSALHYVSRDEVDQAIVASMVQDVSDEDN